MSYNKIIKKIVTGTIVKNGVTYTLSVATHTDHWTRPDKVAQAVGQRLLNAVIAWDGIPPTGTVEICARESDHTSTDTTSHMTVVNFNAAQEGTSGHIPTPEKKD